MVFPFPIIIIHVLISHYCMTKLLSQDTGNSRPDHSFGTLEARTRLLIDFSMLLYYLTMIL